MKLRLSPCSAFLYYRSDFLFKGNFIELQRSTFRRYLQETIREGYPWKPDVYLLEKDGQRLIVKDYAAKPFFFRYFVGAMSTRREALIYQKLKGLPGIPEYLGLIDRYAIAVGYIPGRNAAQLQPGELSPEFFKKLRMLIDAVHEREIVLCDLRNIKNVVLGDDGEPYLIDFATAFLKGGRLNFLKNGLFHLFYQDDLLGIMKLKRNCAPHLLTEEERLALEKGVFLQREAIFLKQKGRALLRRLFGFGRIETSSRKQRGTSTRKG